MCPPDAASTHPETPARCQVQLGRVVLVRDMLERCIEHRGAAPPGPPTMHAGALQSHIHGRRKGAPLSCGRS